MNKTNVMRILAQKKISYKSISYDISDGLIDGISVANKISRSINEVFKTLVCIGKSSKYYVFVIPVSSELDLKLAAKSSGEKSIAMLEVKNLKKITGYLKGGCSPIGMKKLFPTFIDFSAKKLDQIVVSGGLRGQQILINPNDLINLISAKYADIIDVKNKSY